MLRSMLLTSLLFLPLLGEGKKDLSPEKHSLYNYQQHEIDSNYEKLRNDWIAPLLLKGSTTYSQSPSNSMHDRRDTVSAGITQDVFRSGGITYAIDYADAKYRADQLGLRQEISLTNKQLANAVLTYRKNLLLLDQSELKLKNYRIEIFLKRKQYEAGDIDITLLNNALMNQSTELKNNAAIRMNIAYQKYQAAKLSDLAIEDISLPVYTLLKKESYLDHNWDVQYTKASSESAAQQYGIVKSSYYPKLTLLANAGIQRYGVRENPAFDYDGSFYDAGLQLTIPLTYNASAAIQEAQASYLKLQAKNADTKRQVDASYEQSLARIENYQRLIAITQENLLYYDELLETTNAAVKTGYKAGYDLQTLQNTKAIEAKEIAINEINIQIELADLHYMVQLSQENL